MSYVFARTYCLLFFFRHDWSCGFGFGFYNETSVESHAVT